jgi:spore germination cell wall hydrolase CwlJ-like protein
MNQGTDAPSYTRITAWELTLLALCAWREARDQGYDGMLAVAWSIRNRVIKPGNKWWGNDWEEVIEKPWQFSSFNANDPNAKLLPGDPSKDTSWDNALRAAERAYLGIGVDPTMGATHYYNPKVITTPPAWVNAQGTMFKIAVKDHRFYIAV